MARRVRFTAVLVVIAVLCVPILADLSPSVYADSTTANVTVIIVIDNSGSMLDNDPEDLRFATARMFIRLLDIGDRVAVVVFADNAEDSTDLLTIASEADRNVVLAAAVDRPVVSGTNMNAAFEQTASFLQQDASGNRQYVMFLTDGWPELEKLKPGDPVFDEWWGETVKFARAGGAPVLGVALNMTSGSTRYLEELVASTDGTVFEAGDSTQLADAYLAIFGQLKGRTVLEPLIVHPSREYLFEVPPLIQRAYFIILSDEEPSATVSVYNSPANADVWTDRRFAVISAEPGEDGYLQPGEWRIILEKPASDVRAILVSRFGLTITAPLVGVAPVNEPFIVTAHLSELLDDGSIALLSPDVMELEVQPPSDSPIDRMPMNDDGVEGDVCANDLLYSYAYGHTSENGTYEYTVTAHHNGMVTTASGSHELIPFPDIAIDSPEARRYTVRDEDSLDIRVRMTLEEKNIELPGATIVATLKRPDATYDNVELDYVDGIYAGNVDIAESGEYALHVEMQGVYQGVAAHADSEVAFEWSQIGGWPTIATSLMLGLLLVGFGALRFLWRRNPESKLETPRTHNTSS
jgi:Mg-chelatase subunit ChlD